MPDLKTVFEGAAILYAGMMDTDTRLRKCFVDVIAEDWEDWAEDKDFRMYLAKAGDFAIDICLEMGGLAGNKRKRDDAEDDA
ncbi:hypothetical protein MMC25_005544 [Agyrium rufum]|nr:hypothetical protein [Agyrium rufum]